MSDHVLPDEPQWYQHAIIYELHVRAFRDSNGDGVGDFAGLTEKLDYLQDLGVTAIWLLPFYPSPLRDDGYDIADYTAVHPDYGNLRQFKRFVSEAHKRGLRVITELVLNHTSDQHPWFQRAIRAQPGTSERDFYVWSDTPERWSGVRVIFQDFEVSNWTWHDRAGAYYWHRFYHHQPDLNFDNPDVRAAVKQALDHWAATGVDGMRLDAIPYLFERDGTNGENLPETHEFLKELRAHLDANWPHRMFLAEANQWPEDAAAYFGDGDECHMNFHFPLMPRLFMAIRQEDRFPIVDILQQTPALPPGTQWATFLRNHDELTLEMVTDEERDYMYRAYAHDPRMRVNLGIRRRLAPLVDNDRRQIELLNSLLFSLPGTPVLYYGDEIGMGDNIYLGDRNGVRTPMQWSADRNAGFSSANPQRLYLPVIIDPEYHYETVNVEAQQNNPQSLLWWMKHLIGMRKRSPALSRGTIEFLHPENAKVLAFVRSTDDEQILVVANLSRYAQPCELDVSEHRGKVPVEMFGRTEFPPIVDRPYQLTLGPYAVYWFTLEDPGETLVVHSPRLAEGPADPGELPEVTVSGAWTALLTGRGRERLEAVLPDMLRTRRWFGGKARSIRAATVVDTLPLGGTKKEPLGVIAAVAVQYVEGDPDVYALPLAFAEAEWSEHITGEHPGAALARVRGQGRGRSGILYDALFDPRVTEALLRMVARQRRLTTGDGEVTATRASGFGRVADARGLEGAVLRGEQSNTTLVYGDHYVIKVLRRLDAGTNPDLEVSRFLTERAGFAQVPPVAGAVEWRFRGQLHTLAIAQRFVENGGDAWSYTLDELRRFVDRVLADGGGLQRPATGRAPHALDLADEPLPAPAQDLIGPYLDAVELLGERTADLHLALSRDAEDPVFAPEPFSSHYQRSIYQSMRNLTRRTLQLLRQRRSKLPASVREQATAVAGRETELLQRFERLTSHRLEAVRTRIHGDYHLGQVLHTGPDFVIIDFEGEPARPIGERRLKRSPLRDVAGMLRSLHYASHAALLDAAERGAVEVGTEVADQLQDWLRYWHLWSATAYLRGYLGRAHEGELVPVDPDDLRLLIDSFLLEKAIYEVGYELNNRPGWLPIPLQGINDLLDT